MSLWGRIEQHPRLKVCIGLVGAVVLGFGAYWHFMNGRFFLFATDVPFVLVFVYITFEGISDLAAGR